MCFGFLCNSCVKHFWYDMIYLLTAVGLTPGGSSTVHIYTQTIHKEHSRHKQYTEQHSSLIRKSADRAPSLRGIPWHLPYNWGKKHEKTLSQGSRRMSLGKEYIQNRAYLSIIIIIIIYLSWSWATCWPVPVSRIQKSLQRSACQ